MMCLFCVRQRDNYIIGFGQQVIEPFRSCKSLHERKFLLLAPSYSGDVCAKRMAEPRRLGADSAEAHNEHGASAEFAGGVIFVPHMRALLPYRLRKAAGKHEAVRQY